MNALLPSTSSGFWIIIVNPSIRNWTVAVPESITLTVGNSSVPTLTSKVMRYQATGSTTGTLWE